MPLTDRLQIIDAVCRALDEMLNGISSLARKELNVPRATSPAALKELDERFGESHKSAFAQGIMLQEAAADHAWALIRTLEAPRTPIATYTCARATIEASATLGWLMRPWPSLEGIAQRSIALRYREVEQQMKVFRAARVKRDLTAHQDRLDEIVDQAAAQGWEPLLDQRGQHCGAGIRIPSATDMIREILGQEFEYRLLSSAAHGQLWAIRELAFAEMDPATDVAREHGFAAGFEKSLSILGIQWVATAVARALARGAWSLASYAHWDLGHLRGTFDTASNQLRLGIARDSHDPSAPNASS